MRRPRLILLALVSLLIVSCGYQVGPRPPESLAGVTSIAVPTAENRTLEPGLAPLLTSQIVSAATSDGTYRIGQVETADTVLEVTIKDIERRQRRSVNNNIFRTRELGLSIRAEYQLRRNDATGEVLRRGIVAGDSTVFPSGNYQTAESDALQDASRRLANDLITELANGW